ncbi:hypothetical protein LINPERHAP2_LOCUS17035 [Linum perenne]
MQLVVEEDFIDVIFETDVEEVGYAVNSELIDESDFGCLIIMCRELLVTNPGFSVQVVRRNMNMVTNVLATRSIYYEAPFVGSSPLIGMDNVLRDIYFIFFNIFAFQAIINERLRLAIKEIWLP